MKANGLHIGHTTGRQKASESTSLGHSNLLSNYFAAEETAFYPPEL